jgi:hemoglobin
MTQSTSLFDKLGGESGVRELIVQFYVHVLADEQLAPFFRGVAIDKLHHMQVEFFTMALGGPMAYSGRPLAHVHHGRGITTQHFGRFVHHLMTTLEDNGVSEVETAEVIERVNSFANEVTGTSY